MASGITSILVPALVALITAALTGYFTWLKIRSDREKWLTDLKANSTMELYKTRLAAYPEAFKIIGELSNRAPIPLTPERARQIAEQVNSWLYSAGGLCASKETRGAMLGIRETCLSYQSEPMSPQLYELLYGFRNSALLMLRRDLDIKGLDSHDFSNLKTMLEELREEISAVK